MTKLSDCFKLLETTMVISLPSPAAIIPHIIVHYLKMHYLHIMQIRFFFKNMTITNIVKQVC